MKKEIQVKAHTRKTKSGKTVTVKAHTVHRESADSMAKEALKKKKDSGGELEASKKKGELDLAKIDAYKGDPNELSEKEQQAWQILTGNYPASDEKKLRKMKSLDKVWAYVDSKGKKKSSTKAPKETKSSNKQSISQADYKEWYHWDKESDPKNKAALRVEKELKSKMGAKKYKSYFDEMTDGYTARGHNKAFKSLDTLLTSSGNTTKASKKPTKVSTKKKVETTSSGSSESLPPVKGLFKKDSNQVNNGWGNVDRNYLRNKIEPKLASANFKLTDSVYGGDGVDEYLIKKYQDNKGNIAYLQCTGGGPQFNRHGEETGKYAYGNVDIYRGGNNNYYDKSFESRKNKSMSAIKSTSKSSSENKPDKKEAFR